MVRDMIRETNYGDVRYFEMARSVAGFALRTTGVYLLDGLLIDTGPPNLAREFDVWARDLEVHQVVLTHHHEDHVGNCAALERRFGIAPYASEKALPRLVKPEPLQFYRRLVWGSPRALPQGGTCVVPPAIETRQFRFRVIDTPGHSDDHICLYEEKRGWLFSGDLYISSHLKYVRADEDVHLLLRSLEKVLALEPTRMFCAHRGEVTEPRQALRRKIDNLEELRGRIRALHRAGLSAEEIRKRLFPSPTLMEIFTRGHFSRANFVDAFLREEG